LVLHDLTATYAREGDARSEAHCIQGLADIAPARAEHAAARQGFEAARTLYRQAGNPLGEAN
jgi:hypothetical protein